MDAPATKTSAPAFRIVGRFREGHTAIHFEEHSRGEAVDEIPCLSDFRQHGLDELLTPKRIDGHDKQKVNVGPVWIQQNSAALPGSGTHRL